MTDNNTLIPGPKPNGKPLRRIEPPHFEIPEEHPEPLGDVEDESPTPKGKKLPKTIWLVEAGAAPNFIKTGKRLSRRDDLYRNKGNGHGLIQVLPNGDTRPITKAADLCPVLVDTVRMVVTKNGKTVSELPTAANLNAMLRSESFLTQFPPVDEVTRTSFYLSNLSLIQPGYNDLGTGNRIVFVGDAPEVVRSKETIETFLNQMAFATNADRTNTVAMGLTMPLRRQWLGEKPIALITSTKSHSGKGTVTDFICGTVPKMDILYEPIDWPMQSQFQKLHRVQPDVGMVNFDNVRLDSAGGRSKIIRSAFLESFVTSPKIFLGAPGSGDPIVLDNRFVVALNTNDGALSPDLMNRSVPIHLDPKGDVHKRKSPIGNPKLDFLPKKGGRIEGEFRGMIDFWKEEGCPLDESVRHPMSRWASVIGGILMVNGFTDFLANYGTRKTADDPIREALSILGASAPNKQLRPMQWAQLAVKEGLARTIFSPNERDSDKGRERAIGGLLKRHVGVEFEAASETTRYLLKLEGGFRRWSKGKNPHTRYVFTVLEEAEIEPDN